VLDEVNRLLSFVLAWNYALCSRVAFISSQRPFLFLPKGTRAGFCLLLPLPELPHLLMSALDCEASLANFLRSLLALPTGRPSDIVDFFLSSLRPLSLRIFVV